MVIKEVPGWARKCIVIGLLLPLVGFMFLRDYSSNAGFLANVMVQDVEVPFLWGRNPVACLRDDVQHLIGGSLGFGERAGAYDCQRHTPVPYRFICLLGLFMAILGVYMFAKGNQLANIWPTDWKVFDQKNVNTEASVNRKNLKIENPRNRPINPRDGGF